MPSISKEESLAIGKMFSWCTTEEDRCIINKVISEVKKGNGLYDKAVNCKGDLYSFKFAVSEHTRLDQKASGELGMVLYHLVKSISDRERMIKVGIVYGTWMNYGCECPYLSHAKLHGKKFPLKKGARIGIFKKIHPQSLVGCRCFIKPTLPF
ncbi:TPA: hypothetical protein PXJ50_003888 [Yersinia enterocolitica]|nr:hypothetical protein [Yersinia enterocolitica]CND00829.1 Uncharacterised protein [Yersinia frederiksenii]HDL6532113.1 hypothetical protein [Yersinia enterocolitica]HDL6670422.1 hypothetical protein [Yersinia enterocolitica]HDL6725845.1 hypothetical protein [Yersinia enterocolitica]